MKFKTVEQEVKPILEQIKETRADDMRLYHIYVMRKGLNMGKALLDSKYRITNGLATYDTVSRVRRKLQAKYAGLKPSREYLKLRKEAEKEYRDYARGKGGATK